jgi:hypothetical protein
MNISCNFKRIENNWWECTECYYVHKKPSSRAPVRLCGHPSLSQPSLKKKPKSQLVKQPRPKREPPKQSLELGDALEKALTTVGITKERVSNWLGRPCGCTERQEKLNNLSRWVKRVISGKTEDAEKHLMDIISVETTDEQN